MEAAPVEAADGDDNPEQRSTTASDMVTDDESSEEEREDTQEAQAARCAPGASCAHWRRLGPNGAACGQPVRSKQVWPTPTQQLQVVPAHIVPAHIVQGSLPSTRSATS